MSAPTIVAELSANLATGDLRRALETIDAAAAAGADAIKLQTWTPGTMCIDPDYEVKTGAWKGRKLAELYREAETPWEWHPALASRALVRGMEWWSTPFDKQAVNFLQTIDCPRYKIASFEILDLDLIRWCASTRKPLIISTGMATIDEIKAAVQATNFQCDLTLLVCTSSYPAPAAEANLQKIRAMTFANALQEGRHHPIRIGLSDHTMGLAVPVAATALGACMIEKHFTLSRADGGPDAGFSLEPQEFNAMAQACRDAAAACAEPPTFGPKPSESLELRRGVYWAADLMPGHRVTEHDIVTARPATDVTPEEAKEGIGMRLSVARRRGEPF